MVEGRTHYDVLGVTPDAGEHELHAAYVTLARRHHPDLAGGDADHMRAVNEAWSVLGDPVRRARYDLGLRQPVEPPAASQRAGAGRVDADWHEDDALRADLEDDEPIGATVVLPRWLSLVPVAAFVLSGALFSVGVLFAAPGVLSLALLTLLLSAVLFLAAPFMALLASRRASRR